MCVCVLLCCFGCSNIVYFSASLCFELHSRKEPKKRGSHSSEKWMRCRTRSVLQNNIYLDRLDRRTLDDDDGHSPPQIRIRRHFRAINAAQFCSEISKLTSSTYLGVRYKKIYFYEKVQSPLYIISCVLWVTKVCVVDKSSHFVIDNPPPPPLHTQPTVCRPRDVITNWNCLIYDELSVWVCLGFLYVWVSVNHAQTHSV